MASSEFNQLKNKLNAVGSATVETANKKVVDIANAIIKNVSPRNNISTGVQMLKGKVFNELPEVSSIFSGITSFIGDIKSEFNKVLDKLSDDTEMIDSKVEQIKSQDDKFETIFDEMLLWLENIDSNLHRSPSYLRTVADQLDDMMGTLNTLLDITANAWDISEDQLEITKAMHTLDKKRIREDKFDKQIEESKVKIPEKKPKSDLIKKEKGFLTKLLSFFGVALLGILSPIVALLTPLLTAIGAGKFVEGFNNIKEKIAPVKDKKKSKKSIKKRKLPVKALAGAGLIAGSTFKGAASLAKGSLKFLGKLGFVGLIASAVYGAGHDALKEYNKGGSGYEILKAAIGGGIFEPIQSTLDLIGWIIGKDVKDVREMAKNFNLSETTNFIMNKIRKDFIQFFDSMLIITDTFTKWAVSSLTNLGKLTTDNPILFATDSFTKRAGKGLRDFVSDTFYDSKQKSGLTKEQFNNIDDNIRHNSKKSNLFQIQQDLNDYETMSTVVGMERNISQSKIGESIISAPISSVVHTNNFVSGNLIIRNPDGISSSNLGLFQN